LEKNTKKSYPQSFIELEKTERKGGPQGKGRGGHEEMGRTVAQVWGNQERLGTVNIKRNRKEESGPLRLCPARPTGGGGDTLFWGKNWRLTRQKRIPFSSEKRRGNPW